MPLAAKKAKSRLLPVRSYEQVMSATSAVQQSGTCCQLQRGPNQ
jgi:hypothetical protein